MGRRAALGWVIALALSLFARPVYADRPTSGSLSLLGGRTLGVDQLALAAGIGWPGVWAQVVLAPSSTFNVGVRGSVLYGSPLMGVDTGIGGDVSMPMRIHFYGRSHLDLAVLVRPLVIVGEGSVVGERGLFASEIGWGAGVEVGLLGGYQLSDAVTLAFGTGGEVVYVDTPEAPDGNHPVGTLLGRLALEALMGRETLLFVGVVGGYGFARDRSFDGRGAIRVSLGLGYLL